MDFQLGTRYESPVEAGRAWFYEALGHVRQARVGNVPITLHILGGGDVSGLLHSVNDPPLGQHGAVSIERPDGTLLSVPCEDIDGFTLHEEPPPERGDELRG